MRRSAQTMSIAHHHAEWLPLVEVSGPFLSMPVLQRVFPQGLDAHAAEPARNLRLAFQEWEDNQRSLRPDPAIHHAWVRFVLLNTLELPGEALAEGQVLPPGLEARMTEHGETLRPDLAVLNPPDGPGTGKPRLLINTVPREQHLEKPLAGRHWKASPAMRMMELLHASDVTLGLVTNGEHWMLVHAPRGETTGFASWYASLWLDEPLTLRAFRTLLGAHRFFGVPDGETLEALIAASSQDQQEVTDRLGYQVRRAVEVLIQRIDRIDKDRGRALLQGVEEKRLYEAALTVMMRLVFLFSAEERDLLLLGDPLYDQHYAVSTLSAQLREAADQHGEEVLERHSDAWSRLLATFRAVYGGVQHEAMRLPPYGGTLFDPDRFPFLEGRPPGTRWRETPADPLPIDNRTVLHLLEALQILQVKVPGGGAAEGRRISFRALNIEQIGHVYEGLLDHGARRADEPVLGINGATEPEIPLGALEEKQDGGTDELISFLQQATGRSESALRRALENPALLDEQRLVVSCDNDRGLCERLRPFAALLREDSFGYPSVITAGSVYVTQTADRRTTGTHYTPRSLTIPIVQYTLEPLVYHGPAEGLPEEQWKLRTARALLDLKVCDMAMGSGAFLVQACRYLSERLVEAWEEAESASPGRVVVAPDGSLSTGALDERPLPRDAEERLVLARRVVADHCLYGVDKNAMAVEMAKLSLWLITLGKGKPFTFLDHRLKHGDSLVGCIWRPKQLGNQLLPLPVGIPEAAYATNPGDDPAVARSVRERNAAEALPGQQTLGSVVALHRDADSYCQLADLPDTPEGMEQRTHAYWSLRGKPEAMRRGAAADLWCAAWFWPLTRADGPLAPTTDLYRAVLEHGVAVPPEIEERAAQLRERIPFFHWTLEFPDVFAAGGFDALVGNPPFQGGQKITGALGTDYRDYLVHDLANGRRGSADLCAYFFLRARQLLRDGGMLGMLATNTIAQGDTREVGLDQLTGDTCVIPRAEPSRKWPGSANLEVAQVWVRRGKWSGPYVLNDSPVRGITSFLTVPGIIQGNPHRLAVNAGKSFQGSTVLGMGFVLSPEEAEELIESDARNRDVLFPYLNGEDVNSRPDQSPSRWVINFRDWPLRRGADGKWRGANERARREWLRSGVVPDDYLDPVAADYPYCLGVVEERVRPERERNRYSRTAREQWWLYERARPELYSTIAGMERVLVIPETTKYCTFSLFPTGMVFSHMTKIVTLGSLTAFGVLCSSLHESWARAYSSTLETRLKYIITDAFETFPFPLSSSGGDRTHEIAEQYSVHRHCTLRSRGEGLTSVYNRFHNPVETAEDIARLRELHVEIDRAVADAYNWTDLALDHGFHTTSQGVRYTISEAARREVLGRLLQLNHERYAEEVTAGLHDNPNRRGRSSSAARGRQAAQAALIEE